MTLAFNILLKLFGGGWGLSGRLTKIETSMTIMQVEISKLVDVLSKVADMHGSIRVLEVRHVATDQRVTALEGDVRELRHGEGFVRGPRGIDREY